MDLILQPEGSNLCGQTCVAMVAGTTLTESITAFGGHKGKTRWYQLEHALRKKGIQLGKLTRGWPTDEAIIRIRLKPNARSRWSHYIVWTAAAVHDPCRGRMQRCVYRDNNSTYRIVIRKF